MGLADRVRRTVKGTIITKTARKLTPETYARVRAYYRVKEQVQNGYTLVDVQELRREYLRAVRWLQDNLPGGAIGDYLEFGVFYGASLACMHRVLDEAGLRHPRLFGFDSFEGLPVSEHPDDRSWRPGQFRSSYAFAREYLGEQGVDWSRVHLVKGWFDETLTPSLIAKHRIEKASLVMVDSDMYRSAREALGFCAPLIKDHTIIFFDDWHAGRLAENNKGEKRAFDEFMLEHPHLEAEEFGSYNYLERPAGKVFRVSVREESTR